MKKKPRHRHKWRDHDCSCRNCEVLGLLECQGCGKMKDDDGRIFESLSL